MNKKILMIGVVLLAICISVGAVSAWEWNFSSSSSSNTDGGDVSFENGVLKLQGIELKIPDGYKQNESKQKLAEEATDIQGAKYSMCAFENGDKEIVTKVFFSDEGLSNLTSDESNQNKTIGGINGLYNPNEFGDNTPTFKFLKDGKLVTINAPDDATLEAILKK